jgi:hypothetical protein
MSEAGRTACACFYICGPGFSIFLGDRAVVVEVSKAVNDNEKWLAKWKV